MYGVSGFRLSSAKLRRGAALAVLLMASACSGGGGGRGGPGPITPPPAPPPSPAPTPVPAPTPTPSPVDYDTSEYRATVGAVSMDALSAYQQGATGRGITVGVIDTGIDLQSEEFGNRIHAASADTAGNGTVDDEGGHGTAVAFTLAGRRNGAGTHGVAFEANVLALRTDRPGSCATEDPDDEESGCRHGDVAIAQALDIARTNGARVVNISLGGSEPASTVLQAISRATAAGMIIVISAGNDGEAQPDTFAATPALDPAIARGLVIIAGSVDAGDQISDFSNRAGAGASVYLSAVGEGVRAPDANNTPYLWSGTSFSAPQIAGAAALLAQAFPNLTGRQIVELLYATARDAGASGTDSIYGRGVLDLTRAFQPVGTTGLASTGAAVSLDVNATLSAPMGDATSGAGVGAVVLDSYDRAFAIDLARTVRREGPSRTLAGLLRSDRRHLDAAIPGGAIAVTIADADRPDRLQQMTLNMAEARGARAIAASITGKLGSDARFAIGASLSGAALAGRLVGRSEPAFLIAGDVTRSTGFDVDPMGAAAVRHQLGAMGVTVSAESGDVLTRGDRELAALRHLYDRSGYHRLSIGLDRRFGDLAASATLTRLEEADTLLGAHFSGALGAARATSHFVDLSVRYDAGDGWTLGGSMRQGWTNAHLRGGVEGAGLLRTNGFAVDIGKSGVLGRFDQWGLRIAQPLRVASGGIDLKLPTHWDYASASVDAWTTQRLNLAPTGREIDVELRYATPLRIGMLSGNVFMRRDPGNFAALGDDIGVVARFSTGF